MYNLSVKLPYPVIDNKGTAKYDKATKSLTVTLPVRPPAPVSIALDAADKGSSTAGSAVKELDEVVGATETSPKKSTPAKKASAGHSRWVEGAAAEAITPSASDGVPASTPAAGSGLSLHEEIKRQAEIAVREAKLVAATASRKPTDTPVTAAPVTASKLPETITSASVEQSGAAFIPAAKFEGRRAGYFFKRGEQGVGYYRDAKLSSPSQQPVQSATPASVPAVSKATATSEVLAATYDIFPFACRQTKQALAVIVQVPHIDPTSVRVTFLECAIHVAFRAFADATAASENKLRAVQYGAVLRLPTDLCPGGLDVAQCRHDTASQNMALVLTKRLPQYWARSTDKTDAQIETKSGFSDEDAQNLLQVEVYVQPPAPAVEVATSVRASKVENTEQTKTVKDLENAMQSLQFSSSEALFELD